MVHLNLTKKSQGATQKQNDAAPAAFEYEFLFTFDFLKPWLDYYSSFLCVFIQLVFPSRINAQIDLCFMDCIDICPKSQHIFATSGELCDLLPQQSAPLRNNYPFWNAAAIKIRIMTIWIFRMNFQNGMLQFFFQK